MSICFVVTRINWYGPGYDFSNCFPVRVFVGPDAETKAKAYAETNTNTKDQSVTYTVDRCTLEKED